MKNFINISDCSSVELRAIIEEAKKRKQNRSGLNKSAPDEDKPFEGKSMAMIFEKPSTRTRMSFDIAVKQLGGSSIILNPDGIHYGKGDETLKDTAKVLTEYVDIVMLRTSSHKNLEEFSKYSKIPIINGLSDQSHPCQIMADIMTIEEHFKTLDGIEICWLGDGNNVCNSWIDSCKHFNFNLRICTPTEHKPKFSRIEKINKFKQNIKFFEQPIDAVKNANVLVTDTWSSMGTENSKKRIEKFKDFQVNSKLVKHANNNVVFLHCMPAHRGQEVSSEIIDGEKVLNPQ